MSVSLVTGDKAVLKSFPDLALTMEAFLAGRSPHPMSSLDVTKTTDLFVDQVRE